MSAQPIFITGIGTGIGKTLVAAVITEKLQAGYWKPVQAGFDGGTDSQWMQSMLTNTRSIIYPELYQLRMPASPHIAAREENRHIDLSKIVEAARQIKASGEPLVIEGAGGLMVPLNESEFVIDLIRALEAKVILVSRNYLGSINHSLLTARLCRQLGIPVLGWVFNDQYLDYEKEIVQWSGYPSLGSIPFGGTIHAAWVQAQGRNISL